jgi:hypothetical protein
MAMASTSDVGVNPKLPTWDGNWKTYADYRFACLLELDGCKEDEKRLLAPRLVRNLSGQAWECCLDVDRTNGLDYMLQEGETRS